MSLIHDSLRKLESKQINKRAQDSTIQSDYVDAPTDNLLNKSWTIALLLFLVLLVIFMIIRNNGVGFNNLALQNHQQTQKESNDIVTSKPETSHNKTSVVDEKVNTPVAVTIQPLVKVKETTVELAEVNVPTISKVTLKEEKVQEKTIVFPKTLPKKIQETKPAVVKKKAPLIVSKVHKTKARKPTKLTVKETRRLVNNLQMYIEENNQNKVESLLGELQKSSGADSLVYLRMHAYWSSLQKDDDTAVRMYKKILFQKPNDIQAGTNLALIEARQDHIVDAVERLKALQKYYPSDKNIQGYIKRIEVMK